MHTTVWIVSENSPDRCEMTASLDSMCRNSLKETGEVLNEYPPYQDLSNTNLLRLTYTYTVNSSLVQSVCCVVSNNVSECKTFTCKYNYNNYTMF